MTPSHPSSAARGRALATLLHILVLVCVLGEIVYLASRYRVRFDTTSDHQYSLTESTRSILAALDKRLQIGRAHV